jgi:ATP-binding cassette subfamily B protein
LQIINSYYLLFIVILKTSDNLFSLLQRLFQKVSARRRRQLVLAGLLMLVSSLAEVMSLGAVIPFLAVLTEPELVWTQGWIQKLVPLLGWQSAAEMTGAVCVLFALVALGAGGLRILMIWVNFKLANAIGSDLGTEVYRRTLYQLYQVHASRNSSEVLAIITNEVGDVIGSIQGLLQFATAFVIGLGLIATLIWVNAQVALMVTVIFALVYALVINTAKERLRRNSRRIVADRQRVIQVLQEGLGSIRDVILDGNQSYYTEIFRVTDRRLRSATTVNSFLSLYPRYGLEAIALVVIACLAWGLSLADTGAETLATLGVYALGGQKLLPAVQQAYLCWSLLSGNRKSIAIVLDYLEQPIEPYLLEAVDQSLKFEQELRFEQVGFAYRQDLPLVLKDVSFTIRAGHRVGFIGTTGSGKSTCVDLLMGLLYPSYGLITVDGLPIEGEVLRRWQKTVAHVPQVIYLADASIAENIALGVAPEEIDYDRVRQSAQMAQIADFIETQQDGYGAFVGERGIRLSGGQRQRIGIARALYKNASVLVFDEATSALDNTTEQEVMGAINNLAGDLTVIMIAHRLSTVDHCDLIIELSQGRVVAQGTYRELLASSASFRRMVGNIG